MKNSLKKILGLLVLSILFLNNVSALEINEDIPTPIGFKVIEEVIDPKQGPTRLTFSYEPGDISVEVSNYQIFYGKTIGNYPEKTKVTSSNPISILMNGVKGETYYFVIQARKLGRNSGKSNFSQPLKVVIGGEKTTVTTPIIENEPIIDNTENNQEVETEQEYLTNENKKQTYIPTTLPVTGPEHILLIFMTLILTMSVITKNKKV